MASSRGTSNGPDYRDVAFLMSAFQAVNKVQLEIRMTVGDHKGEADVSILVLAHEISSKIGEAPPLASVSLTCSGSELRTLDAALILAMYKLDHQLASHEFAKVMGS